jgi:hypothetical protein
MFYFKGSIITSNSDKEKEIYIEASSSDELMAKIIDEANDFGYDNDAYLPLDYICDCMEPCFGEEEECNYVYVELIESDIFDEDYFETMWDNYMKGLGRGKL